MREGGHDFSGVAAAAKEIVQSTGKRQYEPFCNTGCIRTINIPQERGDSQGDMAERRMQQAAMTCKNVPPSKETRRKSLLQAALLEF